MSKCMCGAYDCSACYPTTYKKYIAFENGEEEDDESGQDDEYDGHDEDYIRYLREGRER